jgi:hypothetical protein
VTETPEPQSPTKCEHGKTGAHRMVNAAANFGCAAVDCPGPSCEHGQTHPNTQHLDVAKSD